MERDDVSLGPKGVKRDDVKFTMMRCLPKTHVYRLVRQIQLEEEDRQATIDVRRGLEHSQSQTSPIPPSSKSGY